MRIIVLLLFCAFSLNAICAEDKTWYFVRHFEKQQGDNPELTEVGKKRAHQLAAFFADIPLSQIYSTDYKRTQQTAASVADKLGLTVHLYDPRQLAEFAQKLRLSTNVLIVGHSNTTPELITIMGGTAPVISESDYGQLFVLSVSEGDIKEKTFIIATSQQN
ncbi:MAG: broad specificity phosphatase PhoE [Paraglaciecola sp.]|jgi:broad specificity phosphatase PhoE